MEYCSERGGVWNTAVSVEVGGIVMRVKVCGIWL